MSSKNCTDTAEFLEQINDWFDIFNSKYSNKCKPSEIPYGCNLEKQNELLYNISNIMREIKVQRHKSVSNTSLEQLLPYLQEIYCNDFKITYILTNRLNQDCLENLFSFLRGMGATNDQPSALNLRYRLRCCTYSEDANLRKPRK